MILGFKKGTSSTEAYHFGKLAGTDRKFIRVVAGVILPQLDMETGAAVVVAENFRNNAPQDLTILDAIVGAWPEVENALTQMRQDLKFGTIVTDTEANRYVIIRIPGMTWGLGECPCATYAAPEHALSEVGRQKVDKLFEEGRLHADDVIQAKMEIDPERSAKALQCAVVWMQDLKPIYKPGKEAPKREKKYFGQIGL